MTGAFAGAAAISLLLDGIPVAAILLLTAAFLRGRSACKKEEKTLREKIDLFENGEAPDKNSEDGREDKDE